MLELYDTHTHLNSDPFITNILPYLSRAREANVKYMNVIGYDLESSARAVDLALAHEELYAVIGIHPHDAVEWSDEARVKLEALLELGGRKVLAIGEIGLDYHFSDRHSDSVQAEAFVGQMDLAFAYNLPFVVHCRDAQEDCWKLIEAQRQKGTLLSTPGVFHCFSGDQAFANRVLSGGFYLGFDGPITFKNGQESLDIALNTPMDRLVLETDCPYLAPVPKRGKTNEPSYLPFILEKLAETKDISYEEISRITTENAKRLFNLVEQ